jgi:hypothetical protein
MGGTHINNEESLEIREIKSIWREREKEAGNQILAILKPYYFYLRLNLINNIYKFRFP